MDRSTIKQLDYLGALLMAVGSVCFVYTLLEVGYRKFTWSGAPNVALLTISSAAWIILFTWEWYISRTSGKLTWILPQLPWRILTHRPMVMAIM
jgi:hypothetical protein